MRAPWATMGAMTDLAQPGAPPADAPPSTTAPASSPAPNEAEYEFDSRQNLVIAGAGNRARIFGILCGITGAVMLLASLLGLVGVLESSLALFLIPAGVFNLILGVLFTRAGTALTHVVTTEGKDVTLMMDALGNLSKAFLTHIVATIVLLFWVVSTIVTYILVSGVLGKLFD
jgi:hypothetical protein